MDINQHPYYFQNLFLSSCLSAPILLWAWYNTVYVYSQTTGGWFDIKMPSCQYRNSLCADTDIRPSYLHDGISYTGKITCFFLNGHQSTLWAADDHSHWCSGPDSRNDPITVKKWSDHQFLDSSRFLDPIGFHKRSCFDRIMILAILLATRIVVGSEISSQQLVILSVISP